MNTCDCRKGVPGDASHKAAGSYAVQHGLNVYSVSAKSVRKGTLLFLPDVFGLAMHNIILADLYTAEGFDVILVDYLEDDPIPVIFMKYIPGTDVDKCDEFTSEEKEVIRKVDLAAWNMKHNPTHIWSLIVPFVEQVTAAMGPKAKLYVLGHCFGGKYAFKLAQGNLTTAAISMHPSFLEPSDSKNFKCPVFVGCAETDFITPTLIQDMISTLPGSEFPYKFIVYGGTRHGFASRADMNDEIGRRTLLDSFNDSVRWISSF